MKFDPDSSNARAGLAFQESVGNELGLGLIAAGDLIADVKDVRAWLRDELFFDEELLSVTERLLGDLTFVRAGKRRFVECCLAMGRWTKIDEEKRLRFWGKTKFYCLGVADVLGRVVRKCYVPSLVFNSYLEKCPLGEQGGKSFRVLGAHLIGPNIRSSAATTPEFIEEFLGGDPL